MVTTHGQSMDWLCNALKGTESGPVYPPPPRDCYCSVCTDERDEHFVVTPCGHAYHGSCLLEWCIRCTRPTCPTCRAQLDAQWIWSCCHMEDIIWPEHASHVPDEVVVEAREWLPIYLQWNDIQEWQSITKRWREECLVRGHVAIIRAMLERKWTTMVTQCYDLWNRSISDPSVKETASCGLQMLRTSIRDDSAFMGQAMPLAVTLLVMTHLRPSGRLDVGSIRQA